MAPLQRAPSTICLLCAACKRRVTPCLVCAHLLPCCSCCNLSASCLPCRRCKVKNLTGDEERRLLGFPPASALPTSMVRRLLIAYIGRPSCTVATHLLYQQLQQTLVARQQEAAAAVGTGMGNDKGFVTKFESLEEIELLLACQVGLPFVQREGIVKSAALPLQKEAFDAQEDNHLLLAAGDDAAESCSDCSGTCKLGCVNDVMVDSIDVAVRRCQQQLVALHCAEALSADSKQLAYPLCNSIVRPSWSMGETQTHNTKMGYDCSSGLRTGFSVGMLRMVTAPFSKDFDVWLAQNVENSQERCTLEDILFNVEAFTEKQDQILDLQRSMLRSAAAQKQAAVDCKADMPVQSLHSTARMLEQFYADRTKERMEKLSRAAEPFLSLPRRINLVLEFLYTRVNEAALLLHAASSGADTGSVAACSTDILASSRHMQTAVEHWLLLYHDVAHATALIC